MHLSVHIVPGSATPIFRQIVEQIAVQVRRGELQAGTPLPSVRTLAEQLVLNPNTVARAYQELIHSGVIESHRGRGVVVAIPRERVAEPERHRRLAEAIDRVISEAALLGIPAADVRTALERRLDQLTPTSFSSHRRKDHHG